jgi:uncharacterized membrane protein YebE (DUF533 family)
MQDDSLRGRAANWYFRETFGLTRPPPTMEYRALTIAMVSVAGSDGSISTAERNWIVGLFAIRGYPERAVKEVMGMNTTEISKLRQLIRDNEELRKNARLLVYDAIRVAGLEDYSVSEQRVVRELATALGVDENTVEQLEALIKDEDDARLRRIRLLFPEGHTNLEPRYARK